MYTPRKKVLWFAVVSRIAIFILQVIFNALTPDHHADAFKRPSDPTEKVSPWDRVAYFSLDGLTRWDGEYFLHVARYGYTYENTLAFYPLYPGMIRVVGVVLLKVFSPALNIPSALMLAAALINLTCFAKSAIILYDLTESVFEDNITAYKAAILYCINPAGIFFTAVYSEAMFAYFTFHTMLGSVRRTATIYFPLALSTLVRSNGIVNVGFPVYFGLKNLCSSTPLRKRNILSTVRHILKPMTLNDYFAALSTLIISMSPFLLLQIYNYAKFCGPADASLPAHILRYAAENDLVLSGNAAWCNASVPLAYSYVQRRYWNVGFLRYYRFKQMPNFILAFPVLLIMLHCVKEFLHEHKDELYSLGLFDGKAKGAVKKYPLNMFVFVAHGLFLTISCLFFVHIQVSTRLLASASPLIYWYCALIMSHKGVDSQYEIGENMRSKWKVFFLSQERYTLQDKLVLSYFIGYTIVGCFMFSNFLPWT
ncbi:PREDICTED: GPI mannosyltransferase 2 [Dinoponera quadriceps]|uniref:GPI mannosyltransferase 2 n=1 Tax=Dinoponera quadriceps TaxID=609295 RepID=A0A6P3XEX6_DINQU|nr:PREDICTED: GPI mannosyltransferase 2 [Dinoponera quadriceps]XP_014476941.1 PREDICTED: GPI mannosyltransferase 2 [Dinoponera quadriceps]